VLGSTQEVLKGSLAAMIKLGLTGGDGTAATEELTRSASQTGISEDTFVTAAGVIGTSSKPVFVFGSDAKAADPVQALRQLAQLAKLSGAALLTVKGEANSMAAAQYGLEKAFVLNGHQAAYVALGDDKPSQRLVQRLEKAPFLAVQASYVSRLTAMADIVLPVEMWAEEEGHYLNLEGRLQKSNPALSAVSGVESNEAVLKGLADRLGVQTKEDWQASLCERVAPVQIAA